MALDEQDFVRMVLNEFPSLRGDLGECEGLLHLQMMEFEIFTEKAAAMNQRERLERCLRLADLFMTEGNECLSNALGVSFLEHLPRQGDAYHTLRQVMSSGMCKEWDHIVAHMNSFRGKDSG
jgi:hypothetical protein